MTPVEIKMAWAADIAIAHAQATIAASRLEKMLATEKLPLPGKVAA
jgi:hypothetical protein